MNEKLAFIKNNIAPKINKVAKSIEQINNEEFILNDSYLIRIFELKDPLLSKEDIKLMYAFNEENNKREKLIYIDEDCGFVVCKIVHRKKPLEDSIDERQLTNLIKEIKKIHKKEAFEFLTTFEMFTRFDLYKTKTKVKIDGRYERKIVNKIKKIIEKESLTVCHNHLNRKSMLFGYDDVALIDLRYCSLNYYQFDLASIIDTFNLDENQINKMLKTYYGKHFSMLKSHKIMIFTQFLRIFNYYFYSYIYSETQSEYFKSKAEVCYKKIIADKVR